MSVKMNKNNKEYPLGFMPEHYPVDRVYLHGDITDDVESEIGRNCHKALTFTASTTYGNVKDLIDFSRNPYLKFDYNSRTILCHLYRQGTGTFDFMSLGALVSESYLVRFGSTGLTVYAYNDSGSTTTTITSSITDAVLYY